MSSSLAASLRAARSAAGAVDRAADERYLERSEAQIAGARAGDRQARDAVFEEWLPVVLAWCARLGGARVDPEDAAHDVFLVVMRRLADIERPDRFSAWLFGITRRVLRQHRRRAWITRWRQDREVDEVPDARSGAEARACNNDLCRQVWRVLDALPASQREVLVLAAIEDRSLREVSELLGVPQGTVASRMRLARAKFERLARARHLEVLVSAEPDR